MLQSMRMQNSFGMQESQGIGIPKIYIATKVTPVYSELVNQQQYLNLRGGHNCRICGRSLLGLRSINNSFQGVMFGCPIHG